MPSHDTCLCLSTRPIRRRGPLLRLLGELDTLAGLLRRLISRSEVNSLDHLHGIMGRSIVCTRPATNPNIKQ